MRISELRQLKSITQQELAEIIGVKNYTIANWEQGRSEPSIMDLIALADYFNCSIDYLVEREDDFGVARVTEDFGSNKDLIAKFSKLSKPKQRLVIDLIDDIYISEKAKKL